MAQTTVTTQQTRSAATQEGALPLHSLVLLGTMQSPAGPKAMLRTRAGRIRTVEIGSRVKGGKITAIDTGSIIISRNGAGQRLKIPGS